MAESKFKAAIDAARAAESQPDTDQSQSNTNESQSKTKSRGGKRSDPNYQQIGVYVERETYQQVRAKTFAEGIEVSDLITELLKEWLDR